MEKVKKVATISDLSGLGRCSLTASIPILSVLGVQCCPFPTAILSCQTGFNGFTFLDMTEEMDNYKKSWNDLKFDFDCIYTGFLGSEKQIDIVLEFVKERKCSLVVVDPIMGDNGKVYSTFTKEMCNKIKNIVSVADIVTPNLTEACILTGEKYEEFGMSKKKVMNIAKKIAKSGPKKVIITGVVKQDKIYNFAYDKEKDEFFSIKGSFNNESYSGTGDIFTSILIGLLLNGHDMNYAMTNAAGYIYNSIKYTSQFKSDPKEGIMFEVFLKDLALINEKIK